MRIAIQSFFDSMEGGAELHTVMLADHLARRNHDVTFFGIIPDDFCEKLRLRGIHLHGVRQVKTKPAKTFRDWRHRILETAADCWIVPKGGIGSGSVLMELAAKTTATNLVTIEHSLPPALPDPRRLFGKLPIYGLWRMRKLITYDIRSFCPTRIVAVSAASAARFTDFYSYPDSKLHIVRNGVNKDRFQFNATNREQTRKTLGLPKDAIVVGSIGRLASPKAFDIAIDAFEKMRSCCEDIDTRLVIFGEGPMREKLVQKIRMSGLSEKVLLPGSTSAPWTVYPAFDIFLISSKVEGLPLTLVEAMASRCVPISFAVGGTTEVIRHGIDGFLVEPQNVQGLSSTLYSVVSMPLEERQALGHAAELRVAESFDENKQMGLLCELIESTNRSGMPCTVGISPGHDKPALTTKVDRGN